MEKKPFNWLKFQESLGYTDDELEQFKADPRRRKAAEVLVEANRRTVVAEVVESHGCAAGYRCGHRLEMSVAGLVKSPNACIFAVAPMTIHVAMAYDRLTEGLDPDGMWFNHFTCQDAGFCNGSWGRVAFKVSVE